MVKSVLMVNYEYPPLGGGGGVFTAELARELAKHIDITVLTSATSDRKGIADEDGVKVLRAPVLFRQARATASLPSLLSFFPSSLWQGRRLVARGSYDLVHSFFAVPSACSGILLARTAGIPHVLSLLGGDVYDPTKRLSPHRTPLLFQAVKALMTRSDRVISLSRDIKSRAEGLYGLQRDIDVIPIGIHTPHYPDRARADLGFQVEDIVLVTVGRLVARKGLPQLLTALSQIPERVKLAVVGDGPQMNELRSRADRLGLGERVRFLGYVSEQEKWQLLGAADVYVSTALHEGFGIVFLEAMTAGLPVVCYDEGGQVDFLEDGDTAFLIRLNDLDSFRARLEQLCQDANLRKRMGSNGKAAAGQYSIGNCAARYRTIYDEAVGVARAACV